LSIVATKFAGSIAGSYAARKIQGGGFGVAGLLLADDPSEEDPPQLAAIVSAARIDAMTVTGRGSDLNCALIDSPRSAGSDECERLSLAGR
jgi:hypothetical protein